MPFAPLVTVIGVMNALSEESDTDRSNMVDLTDPRILQEIIMEAEREEDAESTPAESTSV